MYPGALGLGNPSLDGFGWLTADIVRREPLTPALIQGSVVCRGIAGITPAGKAAGTAAIAALAAAACTACCILPFTLPAVILASAGGTIAVLDHAHAWVTRLAIFAVACAWLWIAWQLRKTQRRAARSTVVVMIIATLLTTVAASWPVIEPVALNALGGYRKEAHGFSHNE
jgi:cytochrome bd-type quinol oxidase subunit 2